MTLKNLYLSLTTKEKENLAAMCNISCGYLHQIATRWRGRFPSVTLMKRLCSVDTRLSFNELMDEFHGQSFFNGD